jgi:ABC-type transport system involved in cytochrome c biogenesis ATPase subunit
MAEALAIETRGLSKHYGRIQAVRELDLTVSPGEIFGFLGPNGAGKTTTIRMLMGLIRPSSGQAAIFGRPCSWVGARGNGLVGAMVETPSFYDYLTGRENLELYSRLSGKVEPAEVDRALELVGMRERETERVRGYSHGMRQRLGLALAILPLQRAKATVGALVMGSAAPQAIRMSDVRTITLLAHLAASWLEAAWEIEEVSRRSRTDQLTGMWNRRHFDEALVKVLAETDRFGGFCALVIADVDQALRAL